MCPQSAGTKCIPWCCRSKVALRLKFEVCKELRGHVELLPETGYIQAMSSFSVQLKFLPRCGQAGLLHGVLGLLVRTGCRFPLVMAPVFLTLCVTRSSWWTFFFFFF